MRIFSELTKKDEFDGNTEHGVADFSLQIFVEIVPKIKQVSARTSVSPSAGLSPIPSRRWGGEMGQVK